MDPASQSRLSTSESDSGDDGADLQRDGQSPRPLPDAERTSSPEGDIEPPETEVKPVTMAARAYQLEMLEQSLQRNIIVAMDTGSGKTQVAVLRIKAELDKATADKRMWFLANTVALGEQQFNVLRSQIPSAQAKFLCGADDIDNWSEQSVWDGVLLNVRIVVSTYQVLFDALQHGFVRLDNLALVVFDEAHNCAGRHSGRRIMMEHYWPAKWRGDPVPCILGLTASPIMRSAVDDLETLESTLDAICRSPSRQREELLAYVNRPRMVLLHYEATPDPTPHDGYTSSMLSLRQVLFGLDIMQDPYIKRLRAVGTERALDQLRTALDKNETYTSKTLRSFLGRSVEMCRQLGPWAADYYLQEVLAHYGHLGDGSLLEQSVVWHDDEKQYLVEVLQRVQAPKLGSLVSSKASPKLGCLLNILARPTDKPVGIVFVKERATVVVLSHLLSLHPLTADRYRVAGMVGTSQHTARDALDIREYADLSSLEHFRRGKVNLLVATSVLEEGIDVPACNMVVCYDRPANLKAFIQRRGRARMRSSRLYLMLDTASQAAAREWEALEAEMKRRYEDDMRALQEIAAVEDAETMDLPPLVSERTGARITVDDAKGHLEHFCATLVSRKFVESNPYYLVRDAKTGEPAARDCQTFTATVLLPISLPHLLWRTKASRVWRTEKSACKDAAFQAYKALYVAGLLNDNLLPLHAAKPSRAEVRPGVAKVRAQFDPWHGIAREWQQSKTSYRQTVRFYSQDRAMDARFDILLPVPVPDLGALVLYWRTDQSFTMETVGSQQASRETAAGPDHSRLLLQLAYGHRWPVEEKDQLLRFACPDAHDSLVAPPRQAFRLSGPMPVLVRDSANADHPYYYKGWLPEKPARESVRKVLVGYDALPAHEPFVVAREWPKRAGYFRPQKPDAAAASTKPYPRVVPAQHCVVDGLPPVLAHFGMLIPSITHAVEIRLVAAELLSSLLARAGFTKADLPLLLQAICATSAREPDDYERIEFLGDSVLKYCTSINCAAKYPHAPEGVLSLFKDRLVSNARLSRAAVDTGLDQFIITAQVTLTKWRPRYADDVLRRGAAPTKPATRELSTKTLADVVEAIIGAAYMSGGLARALRTIAVFLPDLQWQDLRLCRQVLWDTAAPDSALPATLAPVEQLIGYTFKRKSLLVDAMTHASYSSPGATGCLERLEFIGDAILDNLVVAQLFSLAPCLSNVEMHLLRAALVNGDILAFLVMEWCVQTREMHLAPTPGRSTDRSSRHGGPHAARITADALQASDVALPLWSFMRHSAPDLALAQRTTAERHARLRPALLAALGTGPAYPWALLARLQAPKFYSDLFESVLGAVWVDAGEGGGAAAAAACEALLERSGLLPCLRRVVRDGVHVLHPKEEVGRLADRERVRYADEVRLVVDRASGVRAPAFACRLSVGDRVVARVEGGLDKEEARTRAAQEAVRVLKAERAGEEAMDCA